MRLFTLLVCCVFLAGYPLPELPAQSTALNNPDNCALGRQAAREDLRAGQLGYYFMGHPSPRSGHYARLFREKYGVATKGGGCLISQEFECYNELMRAAICQKFGSDAFERIGQQLDSLYALDLGDREASFIGGDSALYHYLYCQMDQELLATELTRTPYVVVLVTIGSDGSLAESQVVREGNGAENDLRYSQAAQRVLSTMPKWQPKIINGQALSSQWNIPIFFRQSAYNRHCLCTDG
ncbi:MAG: hypothetical protein AAF433_00040 [Bacteroidota bacterium]